MGTGINTLEASRIGCKDTEISNEASNANSIKDALNDANTRELTKNLNASKQATIADIGRDIATTTANRGGYLKLTQAVRKTEVGAAAVLETAQAGENVGDIAVNCVRSNKLAAIANIAVRD